jgi:hypothetical protein
VPAVEAHAVLHRVSTMATAIRGRAGDRRPDERGGEAEGRTMDQVRADVLCDLLIDGRVAAHPERVRGIRASVVVTVPVLSLLSEESEGPGGFSGRGSGAVVDGVGPIPIEQARELCGTDGGWMRVLTHPETAMVLSVGRDRYEPPPSLRRLVKWRAERCMAPGCAMPADRCQIDHSIAWSDGGATAMSNTAPLCQGHHTLKHHGGWTVQQIAGSGGALEWRSPLGRRYVVEPERRVPVFREERPPPRVDGPPPF